MNPLLLISVLVTSYLCAVGGQGKWRILFTVFILCSTYNVLFKRIFLSAVAR